MINTILLDLLNKIHSYDESEYVDKTKEFLNENKTDEYKK